MASFRVHHPAGPLSGWGVYHPDWCGGRVPVFSADPRHDPLLQLADCQDFLRAACPNFPYDWKPSP